MARSAEILWRKSSYSGDQGGECVQIASTPLTHIAVRDSKNPAGPQLTLHPTAFSEFLTWTQSR
ncbi:DUF397 domain-containing protein [Streptomyces acidiscabies]|uniref:DUF397 domain-containing protein n=1 Tax=Streptomyces acidiscabies TaxID=42234 RepID=A0AAP6B6U8_9ACTN|nr:DUF397 domain-containing protein [Streptomyces acidiscabies]MBP5939907.1 DUF397 domain-containing protein [Streptomyces sp. LBUM 1476]MBZ3911096.1 DUF397 domain-containing protein [Streptomyces acidiscabies]MDX2959123.1 DUF397 domain-containing protein [Streptomyces acidiscabies]MDX3025753.1 DUF397 domain-containing protein [Streptomyces acidiscabies]MDX3788208.1 DUF397 domain-containing protein [Streptomyces acidiscabies]